MQKVIKIFNCFLSFSTPWVLDFLCHFFKSPEEILHILSSLLASFLMLPTKYDIWAGCPQSIECKLGELLQMICVCSVMGGLRLIPIYFSASFLFSSFGTFSLTRTLYLEDLGFWSRNWNGWPNIWKGKICCRMFVRFPLLLLVLGRMLRVLLQTSNYVWPRMCPTKFCRGPELMCPKC